MDVVTWLLDGDPAIRWQVLRDLTDAAPSVIAAERAGVAAEGLGARLLAAQGEDGAWHKAGEPTWLSTLFSLALLRATGVDPADPAVVAAMERLAAGYRWPEEHGAGAFFAGEVEPCINGNTLAVSAYVGRADDALVHRLLREQLDDGGWNCEAPPSTRSSYHSTICVLEGLLAYEHAVGFAPEVAAARRRAEAYLLDRGLFRRRSTGAVASPGFLELGFPTRYSYDVLRALDYLRAAGASPDPRAADAIHLVEARRQPDGRWLLDACHDDGIAVSVGETAGEPSRWNTLRALRVLRWYRGLSAR
jgi:hypothetical protein